MLYKASPVFKVNNTIVEFLILAAGTPALMLLSTFLPGLAIGVLKGMMFSK